MIWARIRTGDGRVLTGIVEGDVLHPRRALGDDAADGPPEPMAGAAMLAPCRPGKFIGLWNNYHAAATRNGWSLPAHPLYFLKPISSLSGPGAVVWMPPDAGRVVFEGELGIVIGKGGRNLSPEDAAAAILGYTCINDLTSIDILNGDPSFPQWTRAKGFDGFGVVGPVVATGLDWRDLTVRTLVNGRERQAYPAADMILSPPEIASHLSADMTLSSGDIIACGTSLGSRPVRAGDLVAVVIDGIGSLEITMGDPIPA